MSNNCLRASWVYLLLVFQVLIQLTVGTKHFWTFKQSIHTKSHQFVKGLKDANYRTTLELEKIREISDNASSGINEKTLVRQAGGGSEPGGSAAPPSTCEIKSDRSIFVFGKCPNVCADFSTEAFVACGSLIQFGCIMQLCEGGKFSCSLREDLTDSVVCPGDKIVFENIDVRTFERVSFKVDLKAPPVSTDLYLLSDSTGSMRNAIETAKTKFLDLVNVFDERENVAFGVGFYRDESELQNGFQNAQTITEDRSSVRAGVNSLRASGGGDGDEANLVALYKVATDSSIGWRENSRKILVYFGDWPGHEPTCLGSSKLTRNEVIDALNAKNITVIAVSFPPPGLNAAIQTTYGSCHNDERAGPNQASDIVSATKGVVVSRESQSELVEAIENGIERLTSTFDVDESECVDKINSVHAPALPITLESSEKQTVTNTISLRSSICQVFGSFECRYRYVESAADLEATTVEFVNITGCPSN